MRRAIKADGPNPLWRCVNETRHKGGRVETSHQKDPANDSGKGQAE